MSARNSLGRRTLAIELKRRTANLGKLLGLTHTVPPPLWGPRKLPIELNVGEIVESDIAAIGLSAPRLSNLSASPGAIVTVQCGEKTCEAKVWIIPHDKNDRAGLAPITKPLQSKLECESAKPLKITSVITPFHPDPVEIK